MIVEIVKHLRTSQMLPIQVILDKLLGMGPIIQKIVIDGPKKMK